MTEDRDTIPGMIKTAHELAKAAGYNVGSSSKIEVNAGGAATWVTAWFCTVAAALMFGMAFVGALWVSSEFQAAKAERAALKESQETQQAYINVLIQNSKAKESK